MSLQYIPVTQSILCMIVLLWQPCNICTTADKNINKTKFAVYVSDTPVVYSWPSRQCTPEKWFWRKIVPGGLGVTYTALPPPPPAGSRGRASCGGEGQCPLKLLTLQLFRGILKLLLAAFTVNLEKKKVSVLLTIPSITNDHYFHLHTLSFTENHFLHKCSVFVVWGHACNATNFF